MDCGGVALSTAWCCWDDDADGGSGITGRYSLVGAEFTKAVLPAIGAGWCWPGGDAARREIVRVKLPAARASRQRMMSSCSQRDSSFGMGNCLVKELGDGNRGYDLEKRHSNSNKGTLLDGTSGLL